jgi:NADH-quinone oxidoreductase subunit L
MFLTVALAGLAIYLARYLYLLHTDKAESLRKTFSGPYRVLVNKYWVDECYGAAVVRPVVNGAVFFWKIIDTLLIDGLVNGTAVMVGDISKISRKVQTGYLREYLAAFLIGVVVIIGLLVIR